ncbi:histidine--tRNA ligase, cytoplasmic-like [Cannabis sativa]|uniref:histidine--tRNA ligase, cytoplasmic-like n=1 Tax=Cannabis sativa TaxID=3483 RepID=UPI0029C9C7F9|nr:histidine--tRNA ligase, cytoplasmic-like [Cannabis sativa]
MNGITSFIAKVCRRDNPSKGRYHEFYQCDFDIAGQLKEWGQILTELLDELEIGKYEIKLNHLKLLDGMLEICGVPPGKFRTICSSIDKLDKQPFDQIKTEIVRISAHIFVLQFGFLHLFRGSSCHFSHMGFLICCYFHLYCFRFDLLIG